MDSADPTKHPFLLTPGPTEPSPAVRGALAEPLLYHESSQFRHIYRALIESVAKLCGTTGEPVLSNSSITGACGGVVSNLLAPGVKTLVAINGHFSRLWANLVQSLNVPLVTVEFPWGAPVDADRLESELRTRRDVEALCIVHCETSTGAVSDLSSISEVARKYGVLLIVDAASTLGCLPIHMDAMEIDVVVAGSQKAFGVPPGVAFTAVSDRAMEFSASRGAPTRLDWDWTALRSAQGEGSLYTPAISLWMGLSASLQEIETIGIQRKYEASSRRANRVRERLHEMNLTVLTPDVPESAPVTAAFVPIAQSSADIRSHLLASRGVVIAGGHRHLSDRIIRVGTLGFCPDDVLEACLDGIEDAIRTSV